jgi:hypothetical protein
VNVANLLQSTLNVVMMEGEFPRHPLIDKATTDTTPRVPLWPCLHSFGGSTNQI